MDEELYPDYVGSGDYDDELCDVSHSLKFGKIFNPVFFSIMAVLSVWLNTLVIIILVKYENFKSLTNVFILNLAISDLLFTAALPFWVLYHWNGTWSLGETACKSVNFVFYLGFYSSGFILILMTVHRYIAVVNPLSGVVSTQGLYCIVAPSIVWLASMVIASPYIVFTKLNEHGYCGYVVEDSLLTLWGIYQQIALFILTALAFLFCYGQIIWRLLHPTGQHRKIKTLKVILALMVVFFVGWTPYNVVLLLKYSGENDCDRHNALEYAMDICRLGAFSQCFLNPVFYVFVGVKFKNHLIRFVKGLGRNKSSRGNSGSVRSRQSRMTVTSITSGEEVLM